MYPKSGVIEFYDLEKDPWETKNLIQKNGTNSDVKKLLNQFQNWQLKVGDTVNISKKYKQYLN